VLQLQIMISAVIFRSNVRCLTVLTSEIYPTDYDAKVENTWKITAIHSQRQTLRNITLIYGRIADILAS